MYSFCVDTCCGVFFGFGSDFGSVFFFFFNGGLRHHFRNETRLSISKLLLLSVLKQFFSFIFVGGSKILLQIWTEALFFIVMWKISDFKGTTCFKHMEGMNVEELDRCWNPCEIQQDTASCSAQRWFGVLILSVV